MKLSISNIAWSFEEDEMMYSFLKQVGFDGLEIAPTRIFIDNPYDKKQEALAFKANLQKKYNLEICSLQAICFGKNEAIFGSELERNTIKNYVKQAIDFAKTINCKNLVFGSPKNRIIGEGQEEIAKAFFSDLAHYSEDNNTVLAIEPNPEIYGTNFLNTTQQTLDFVSAIPNKGLKVNIDLGTMIHNDESLSILEYNLSQINHIHISEPFLEPILKREIHKELYLLLKKNNYKNFVSIEMKNPNDIEKVKSAVYYIKDVFERK